MGPVRQNPIQGTASLFICVCIIVAHNIAQNRPDSFPPYPPDNRHYSDDVYLREGGPLQRHYTNNNSTEHTETEAALARAKCGLLEHLTCSHTEHFLHPVTVNSDL